MEVVQGVEVARGCSVMAVLVATGRVDVGCGVDDVSDDGDGEDEVEDGSSLMGLDGNAWRRRRVCVVRGRGFGVLVVG